MQFEEFDKKVNEAAERHHPAYDEKAWEKMNKLLDRHLPLKEDRRRPVIFFILLFLLIGSGVWLVIEKNQKHSNTGNSFNKPASAQTVQFPVAENKIPAFVNDTDKYKSNDLVSEDNQLPTRVPVGNTAQKQVETNNSISNISNPSILVQVQAGSWNKRTSEKKGNKIPADIEKPLFVSNESQKPEKPEKNIIEDKNSSTEVQYESKPKETEKISTVKKDNQTLSDSKPDEQKPEKTITVLPLDKAVQTKKTSKVKKNSFFFSLSAGPDVSFTGNDKLGKAKLMMGAGIGYTFKDKLTIRGGFYSGRKVYTSSPGSYNPPASWWAYYPNLQKVDADCKVYEIPVLLSYNFSHSSKQNWFASAGVSSLLMKKETYNYFYKYTPSGPTVSRKWTITDENKHYFSVLTLSGGYSKNISKTVSFSVEPYVKLPLTGVGFGKVKLNSSGILFSIGIHPFRQVEK